jgi:hypothetical protein
MSRKRNTRFAVNGMLTLPNHTPDIDFILRVTSTPIIKKTIIVDKQINFSGHVIICIEFVSSTPSPTQTVHFISFEVPFVALINHRSARAGMDCQLSASIEHQDFQLTSPKCINKLIVVKVCILNIRKSCDHSNSHCSEPCLTLLCTPDKIKTCPPTFHSTRPITPNDNSHELPFVDYHIPSSQHLDSSDPDHSYNET